ncbi:AraC family transcriptional regulator [Dongshaea marina]|uniref:AraC family transcriptional regulator n=1 Tax=Dongshaea marina TaxID=2047966 RepID=UPI000D3EAFFF|nr:helix-turn-helix transcriptional regulator [Dongshaea marina]
MANYQPISEFSSPLCFQYEMFHQTTEIPPHSHPWGQLNTIDQGIMEILITDEKLIAPSDYGIWVPADVEHSSLYKQTQLYCSIYIDPALGQLPDKPCILALEPLTRELLKKFSTLGLSHLENDKQRRMARVLIDQLEEAPCIARYLPNTQNKLLAPILSYLQEHPGDSRSQKQWAQSAFTTERTLARHCQKELGMTFNEWRQRLRFITALRLLKESHSIQEIAFELGYSSSSAFISMFRRHAGTSPEQYSRQWHQ